MLTTRTSEFAHGRDTALYNLLVQMEAERTRVKHKLETVNPDDEVFTASYWQGYDVTLALIEMKMKAFGQEIERFARDGE